MNPQAKTRLHILLARDAPVGLVIRRGPSKQVATIGWDRRTDTFQLGQWFKGRIHCEESDLSSDGNYFIYAALNGKWDSESKGKWTAISRVPYLKALSLFSDCQGGGIWTANHDFWLNGNPQRQGKSLWRENSTFERDKYFRPEPEFRHGETDWISIYLYRLIRDGWAVDVRSRSDAKGASHLFSKPLPCGWVLQKSIDVYGQPEEHKLVQPDYDTHIPCPNWEWADLDGERLIWAADGKLFAAEVTHKGPVNEKELYDFSDMAFEAIEAPYEV